jgi:hypothetical protein
MPVYRRVSGNGVGKIDLWMVERVVDN